MIRLEELKISMNFDIIKLDGLEAKLNYFQPKDRTFLKVLLVLKRAIVVTSVHAEVSYCE